MSLTLITPPTEFPVAIADVKEWVKQDEIADDDKVITQLIASATSLAEEFTRTAFMPQTWKQTFDEWEDILWLAKPPCIAVDSVKYYDSQGALTTLAANVDYIAYIDGFPARISAYPGKCWPSVQCQRLQPIEVQFQCGYESDDPKLSIVKQGILVQIAHALENRQETEQKLCVASENILWIIRDFRF